MERVIGYIDGFNLYYGLRDSGFRKYYWLDVCKLVGELLKPQQSLIQTKYFTAPIGGPRPSDASARATKLRARMRRQTAYLDALATLPELARFDGHFLHKKLRCSKCGSTYDRPEEKMTDVRIATEMCFDSYFDRFDVAIVVSGDSDLVPPVEAIRANFPKKRIIVAFPPKRHSAELQSAAHAKLSIWPNALKRAQLPDPVVRADGYAIRRPASWR